MRETGFLQGLLRAACDYAAARWVVQPPNYFSETARIVGGYTVSGNWFTRPKMVLEYGDWMIVLSEPLLEDRDPHTQCQAEWLNPQHFVMQIDRRGVLSTLLGKLGLKQREVLAGDEVLDNNVSITSNLPDQMAALLSDQEWRQLLSLLKPTVLVTLHPKHASFSLTRSKVGTGVSDLLVTSKKVVKDERQLVMMLALMAATLDRFQAVGLTPASLNECPDYRIWFAGLET